MPIGSFRRGRELTLKVVQEPQTTQQGELSLSSPDAKTPARSLRGYLRIRTAEERAIPQFAGSPKRGIIRPSGTLLLRVGQGFFRVRLQPSRWSRKTKQAVKFTRLSCHRFRSAAGLLSLSVIAYDRGNLWRRLALPKRVGYWSLTSLQQRLAKTGERPIKHWIPTATGQFVATGNFHIAATLPGMFLPFRTAQLYSPTVLHQPAV